MKNAIQFIHSHSSNDRVRMVLIFLIALAQSLIYLVLLPPWQHYDEPTHFEYAWLIADRDRLPKENDYDQIMRRDLVTSMIEHRFYGSLPRPNWLADQGEIPVGVTETVHPPVYYFLISWPLRLVRHLDLITQLYIVRIISVIILLLTILISIGFMRDILPQGHPLSWAVPFGIVLVAPFNDVMTSINNDVGVVFLFSLMLWACVRMIRFGPTWPRVFWGASTALIGLYTKNTAAIGVLLFLIGSVIAFWNWRKWRWRWLILGISIPMVLSPFLFFTSGDAAYWYYRPGTPVQAHSTQYPTATAPLGPHALAIETPIGVTERTLLNPVLSEDANQLAGQIITIGCWVWSSQPTTVSSPAVALSTFDTGVLGSISYPITVTTTPRFVSWSLQLPHNLRQLHYMVSLSPIPTGEKPLTLYLDGAVLAEGVFPTTAPSFDDITGQSGTWGGKPFKNRIRNGSGEQAWFRLQPWTNQIIMKYARYTPIQNLTSLFDIQRTARFLLQDTAARLLFSFFGVFAWAHIQLSGSLWNYLFQGIVVISTGSGALWFLRQKRSAAREYYPCLLFLLVAVVFVWGITIMRPLPLLEAYVIYPVARYGFPSIIPTMLFLVGGWGAIWPARWRIYGLLTLLGGLLIINVVSIMTIWLFYRSVSL